MTIAGIPNLVIDRRHYLYPAGVSWHDGLVAIRFVMPTSASRTVSVYPGFSPIGTLRPPGFPAPEHSVRSTTPKLLLPITAAVRATTA